MKDAGDQSGRGSLGASDRPGHTDAGRLLLLEDFQSGQVIELGSIEVSEQEIVDFGRRFDPQSFHIDPVSARNSAFGGLIASGWHSVSLVTRLWALEVLTRTAGCGSPGVDEVRWLVPVRPGDSLRGRAVILGTRPSRTKPWKGNMEARIEALNQRDELVLTFHAHTLVRTRLPADPTPIESETDAER